MLSPAAAFNTEFFMMPVAIKLPAFRVAHPHKTPSL
jgi:hypothetical protein